MEMRNNTQELMASARLEAAGQLAAWIAHQINNPLGSISGNAQLLARRIRQDIPDPGLAEKYLRYVSEIQSQTERCARITDDMLDFTQSIEPNLKRIQAIEIIREAVELARSVHPSMRVGMDTVNWSDLPPICADRDWMVRVLFELLSNAAEVSGAGGVRIDLEAVQDRESDGRHLRITIHDSGPGIPVDVLPRVFDPFFSTRAKARGLGLTLSHEMLRKMGGAVQVEKSDGSGSVFSITIPVWGRRPRRR